MCANAKVSRRTGAYVYGDQRRRLLKNSDEHRRYVLQEILRFGAFEKSRVLLQFVGDLINDETATRRQRVICFLQESAFLFDFKNAERNA